MEPQKSFLTEVSEVIDRRRTMRREHQAEQPITQPGRLSRLAHWLMPNGGTLLLIALLIATQGVWARNLQAPAAPGPSATTVNYQGRLADSGGTPINGTRGMEFAIYDAATGGNRIWGPETHAAIPVSNGLFSVGLGSVLSIPTTTWNGDRYLEIQVGGETLSPRELIRSVPIAGMALTVPDGSISTSNLASGTVANRYEIEWFGDETPCTTSSATYANCGTLLGHGFGASFPPPTPGTVRQYRLMVANSDDLTTSGNSYLRVTRSDNGAVIYEFDLTRQWASSDFQKWRYSTPITFSDWVHLRLQIRITEPGHTLWLYRVWVMAEDVVP